MARVARTARPQSPGVRVTVAYTARSNRLHYGSDQVEEQQATQLQRAAVVPDLAQPTMPQAEHKRRWQQIADMYVAGTLGCYPPDYLDEPTPERLLETVDRYEEDLTDRARAHYPLHVIVTIGEPIPVSAARERGGADTVLVELERQLKQMLGIRA